MLVAVGVATAYGLYRFVVLVVRRRTVSFVRDANMAVGHSLQKLTANQCQVFHEVQTPTGVVDNVVVSMQGVYAVCVIARRPGKDNRVRLDGERLSFAPGNVEIPLAEYANKARQLSKILRRQTGNQIRVRPVIAVPGWEVESQASEKFLLVNERNIAMMRGWKEESSYLLNEDLEALQLFLREVSTRHSRK